MLPTKRYQLLIILAALASCLGGLFNDFVYDDIPIIRDNVRLHDLSRWRDILGRPYWPPPFVEQLYRPLTSLVLALEYVGGGGHPIVFRLVSYALYGLASLGVFHLTARIMDRRAALIASLLFAVHPVHTEAVALGVNQAELLVALASLAATCVYIDARRRGTLELRAWALIAALYAVAAFSKENGLILPGILLSAELLICQRRERQSSRRSVPVGVSTLAAVAAIALAARAHALATGSIAAIPAAALRHLDLWDRALLMLQVVPMWLRLLIWPARLRADYPPDSFELPPAFGALAIAGMIALVGAGILAWTARSRAPVVSFGIAWAAVALLPVSNIVPTGVVLAERTLLLPSIGFSIAVAAAGAFVLESSAHLRRPIGYLASALVSVALVLGLVRSESRHRVWNSRHLVVIGNSGSSPFGGAEAGHGTP